MATLTFGAAVTAWVAKTKERQNAVFRESAQRIVELMVMATPVDSGFLRASLQVGINEPLPPLMRENTGGAAFTVPSYLMVIAGAEIGDFITAGYTAKYAAHVEFGTQNMSGRGWVRSAAMQWQRIVNEVAAEAQASARQSRRGR
jgi:Bacteriophage HK97-gp10, putative tail-component